MKRNEVGIRNAGRLILIAVITVLVVGIIIAGMYLYSAYTIKTVYVEGNIHYTDTEIQEMVMDGPLGDNALFLNFKYHNREVDTIPFISAMEVEMIAKDTIRIKVYEKSLAGYVMYLGRCMYFDKDGTIVESSMDPTPGIPLVSGIDFQHVVKYEPLPVDNQAIFAEILDITQSLAKYELSADGIFFDNSYNITLFFEKIRVDIGNTDQIDEKFSLLKSILPNLYGKKGKLKLSNLGEDVTTYTFESDISLSEPKND